MDVVKFTIILLAVVVILLLLFREVVCWYWKINATLSKLDQVIAALNSIAGNTARPITAGAGSIQAAAKTQKPSEPGYHVETRASDADVHFRCAHCGRDHTVGVSRRGSEFVCFHCGKPAKVPLAAEQ